MACTYVCSTESYIFLSLFDLSIKFEGETTVPLNDEHLWKYLLNEDLYIFQEFGIGIVGIGALMWAYGSVDWFYIKEIIAWVGLGGSIILWMHIFGALKEFEMLKEKLEENNPDFFQRFDDARSWRTKGRYRFLYYRVRRLMIYFSGLVSWAWLTIILSHRGIHLDLLANLSLAALIFALALTFIRKYEDIKEEKKG